MESNDPEIALDKIPLPRDYFSGFSMPVSIVPHNILLFSRVALPERKTGYLHHRFVWVFNLRGSSTIMLDHVPIDFRPGSMLLIFPHQFHMNTGMEGRWVYLTFEMDDPDGLEPLRNRPLPIGAQMHSSLAAFAHRYVLHREGTRDIRNELVLSAADMLNTALRTIEGAPASAPGDAPRQRDSLLYRVGRYVHRNLHRPFCIRDIARACAMSGSQLRARFRREMNMSLGAYIHQARMHRAAQMLRSGNWKVKEVADQCGYATPYSFSRAFREATGCPPRKFMAAHEP